MRVAVNVSTRAAYDELMKLTGEPFPDIHDRRWEKYGAKLGISVNDDGTYYSWCDREWYTSQGHSIITLAEYKKRFKTEDKKNMGRRTFKLLKEMPDIKKDALFQEACDDGNQEYKLITPEFRRFDDYDEYFAEDTTEAFSRKAVENNPSWFVEVFPATAAYLTKEELTALKDFLKKQTAKGKKK